MSQQRPVIVSIPRLIERTEPTSIDRFPGNAPNVSSGFGWQKAARKDADVVASVRNRDGRHLGNFVAPRSCVSSLFRNHRTLTIPMTTGAMPGTRHMRGENQSRKGGREAPTPLT